MIKLLFLLLTLCFSLTLSTSHARQAKGLVTFPEFPDGNGLLQAYLQKEIHYPPTALEHEIEGYIIVMLKIEEDNTISDIRLFKDPGAGCGIEVLRAIKTIRPWIPCHVPQSSNPGYFWFKVQFSGQH